MKKGLSVLMSAIVMASGANLSSHVFAMDNNLGDDVPGEIISWGDDVPEDREEISCDWSELQRHRAELKEQLEAKNISAFSSSLKDLSKDESLCLQTLRGEELLDLIVTLGDDNEELIHSVCGVLTQLTNIHDVSMDLLKHALKNICKNTFYELLKTLTSSDKFTYSDFDYKHLFYYLDANCDCRETLIMMYNSRSFIKLI